MDIDYVNECIYNQNIPAYNYSGCQPNVVWTDDCKKSYTCDKLKTIIYDNPNDTNFKINDPNLQNCIYNNFYKIKTTSPASTSPSNNDYYSPYDDLIKSKNICTNVNDNNSVNSNNSNTFNFKLVIPIILIFTLVIFFIFKSK
jgi:ATP-dependent Zn protease